MAAVIGGQNHQRGVGQRQRVEFCQQPPHLRVGITQLVEVGLAHPLVEVAEVIGVGKVGEDDLGSRAQHLQRAVHDCAIPDPAKDVGHRLRLSQVTKNLFADGHAGAVPGFLSQRQEGWRGNRLAADIRPVPVHTMIGHVQPGQHGGMGGQRGGRVNGAGLPACRAACRQRLNMRRAGLQQRIRARAIERDHQHALNVWRFRHGWALPARRENDDQNQYGEYFPPRHVWRGG